MSVQINNTLTALENNPEAPGAASIGLYLIGLVIKITENGRINPMFMDSMQMVCWIIGALVGICSLVGFAKQFFTWLSNRKKPGPPTPNTN